MMKPPKSSAKIVWTYGPICGICLGMIYLAMILVHVDLPGGIGEAVPSRVASLIRVAILYIPIFLVGMLASKQTGQVRTGMQTGLVTGLTVGIMVLASSMLPSFTLPSVGVVVLILGAGALIGAVTGERGGRVGYYRSQQQLQQDPPQQQQLQQQQ